MQLEATVAELQAKNERLQQRVANATEAEEILRRASGGPPLPPGHRRPNPHGLHIVHGAAVAAGGVAAWVTRSRAHKVAAVALMTALTASAVTPSVISAPPASAGGTPPVVHHHRVAVPVPVPVLKRRRKRVRSVASSPAAGSTATSSPVPVDPPLPTPSVTPLPTPLPSVTPPLCAQLSDSACDHNPQCVCPPDGDGDADDALGLAA